MTECKILGFRFVRGTKVARLVVGGSVHTFEITLTDEESWKLRIGDKMKVLLTDGFLETLTHNKRH